jgi:catechol 2,3-dioxygenase-like lactoylglutathione lyase family enzyme
LRTAYDRPAPRESSSPQAAILSRVLHHVSLEIAADEVERTVEFFTLLGFSRIPAPGRIAPFVTWLESGTTQIHLIHTPEPTTPTLGHPAVVAGDFDSAVALLRDAGFKVEDADDLWGERRSFASLPGGQRVEVMAAPPEPRG